MFARIFLALRPLAPLVLRVGLGAGFIYHGAGKLFGIWGGPGLDGFTGAMNNMGFPAPDLLARFVAVVEFGGGIAVLLGALTSYAAAFLFVTMAVAFLKIKGGSFADGGDMPFIYGIACLALLFTGSGPLALDCFIRMGHATTGKLTTASGEVIAPKPAGTPMDEDSAE